MSLRARVILALACAVLAAVLMAGYAARVRSEAAEQRKSALERYGGDTVSVYVASREIVRGEVFSDRNVEAADWLVDLLPEGAVVDKDDLLGATAAATIAKNTPISTANLSVQGATVDVPEGLVAVSVPCSNESAVGGGLSVGSVVDVYVVGSQGARLQCQGIQVLQTNASTSAANLSWVTLAIDPSEVESLIAAANTQKLYFALPSDEEVERRALQAAFDPEAGAWSGEGCALESDANLGVEPGTLPETGWDEGLEEEEQTWSEAGEEAGPGTEGA